MPGGATIHMRTPAALKARWVRDSRAAGLRLTDWIVNRIEGSTVRPTRALPVTIPHGIAFADLRLARDADGAVSLDRSVVERIELASGLPRGWAMQQPEDAVAGLIVAWYAHHRAAGGAADPAAEDLIAEARIEGERGGGLSHPPG